VGVEAAELTERYVGQGYFIQNFLRRMAEDDFWSDEEAIIGAMIDMELIMIPATQYDDCRLNPTYEELAIGFGVI